ncbi:hypothetical protein RJQ12_01990 [Paenibacillus taichungensis]|nr:hypothetical protein [Paenibacillus taichungensis]
MIQRMAGSIPVICMDSNRKSCRSDICRMLQLFFASFKSEFYIIRFRSTDDVK